MSTTKKVLIAIFSIIIIAAFAFLITWGIINFNKVKDGLSGTGLYTKDDVDKAYNDGYDTALKNKTEYEDLINSYKDTITMQTDAVAKLNSEKSVLDKSLKDCQEQVTNLTEQRDGLKVQIDLLNAEIDNLNETITDKDGEISDITAEKQELIEQHTQTVSRLNAQITTLNGQIEDLNTQIQINMSSVSQLNNRIAELQRTIAFYEEFVGQFETEDQALVTFEFAGSVYEVKTVNKGDKVTVSNPDSTEYLIFNGWTLDGAPLDLTTYTVTKNVRIIADVTYKYVVSFTVDGKTKSTQVVEKGNYAEAPSPNPRKSGYTFKYWTLDGETEVHFDQLPIMANTTFIAKFNELHKVDFLYENGEKIINTKSVEHGSTVSSPRFTVNDGEVLNGWKINGNFVDLSGYVINADTAFIADITKTYKVQFIINGDQVYDEQRIEAGHKLSVPQNPAKDNYNFWGWSLNKTDILNVYEYVVNEDVTFYGIFEQANNTVRVYNKPFIDMRQNCFKIEKGSIVPLLGADCIKFEQEVLSGNKVLDFVRDDCLKGSNAEQFKCFAKLVISGNTIVYEEIPSVENLVINGDTFIVPIFNDADKFGTRYVVRYYDVDGSLLGTENVTYGGAATTPYPLRQATGSYDYYYWASAPNSKWQAYLGNITQDTNFYMVGHVKGTGSWV